MLDSACMMKLVAPLKNVLLLLLRPDFGFRFLDIFYSITAAPAPWIGGTILLIGSFSITCRSWSEYVLSTEDALLCLVRSNFLMFLATVELYWRCVSGTLSKVCSLLGEYKVNECG